MARHIANANKVPGTDLKGFTLLHTFRKSLESTFSVGDNVDIKCTVKIITPNKRNGVSETFTE